MLEDLPFELVSGIASHLSYKDLNAFRQALTREDLRDATNAHVVWLNLATQYLAENPHSHLSNIQSLSSLTTNQLRQRFEKRLMVNDIWRRSKEVYPSLKRLRYPPSYRMYCVMIAPGGRWVFCGTRDCTVFYWDLDSDDPEPRVLVPRDGVGKVPGRNSTISGIGFAIEGGDPLSGFVIGLVGCDDGLCDRSSREWLYIWDVTPQENGTLEAKFMKTLPLPYNGHNPCFSFNEHLAARSIEKRVDVYWWKECTETRLVRCTILFKKDRTITDIYVLGTDKLLVYTRYQDKYKGRLYTLEPEHSEVGEYQKAMPYATKHWSFSFYRKPCGNGAMSRVYFDGTDYQQTIAMIDGIFMLKIPALQVNKPTLTRVSDFDHHQERSNARVYGLGSNKGYCRSGEKLYRFGYARGSIEGIYENGVTLDPRKLSHIRLLLEGSPAFDEELGRLVWVTWDYLVLQDFSRSLYNVDEVFPDSGNGSDEVAWPLQWF